MICPSLSIDKTMPLLKFYIFVVIIRYLGNSIIYVIMLVHKKKPIVMENIAPMVDTQY